MIELDCVIPWSTSDGPTDLDYAPSEIDVLSTDLGRTTRFYARVFGLVPARSAPDESVVIVPLMDGTNLVIHDAQAAVRRRARCVRRWAFLVTDLERVRAQAWELGVTIARDSGAPDQIYRWPNGRSLYIQTPDGQEIELVEILSDEVAQTAAPAAAAAS